MTLPASAASDLLTATAIKEPRLRDWLPRIALERGAAASAANLLSWAVTFGKSREGTAGSKSRFGVTADDKRVMRRRGRLGCDPDTVSGLGEPFVTSNLKSRPRLAGRLAPRQGHGARVREKNRRENCATLLGLAGGFPRKSRR